MNMARTVALGDDCATRFTSRRASALDLRCKAVGDREVRAACIGFLDRDQPDLE